jgi:hypothetical protein
MERHILLSRGTSREALLELARRHKSDASRGEAQPSRSQITLQLAPDAIINQAIRRAYDAADAAGTKPPNIKELPAAVHPLLEQKGLRTSGRRIQQLGDDEEFKSRRRPPGKTVASDRRKK